MLFSCQEYRSRHAVSSPPYLLIGLDPGTSLLKRPESDSFCLRYNRLGRTSCGGACHQPVPIWRAEMLLYTLTRQEYPRLRKG